MLKTTILATLAASVTLMPTPTYAAPVDLDLSSGTITQIYNGCGVYGHRGPYGGCRAGGQAGGYIPGHACPWGWHIGPYGQRCWRN